MKPWLFFSVKLWRALVEKRLVWTYQMSLLSLWFLICPSLLLIVYPFTWVLLSFESYSYSLMRFRVSPHGEGRERRVTGFREESIIHSLKHLSLHFHSSVKFCAHLLMWKLGGILHLLESLQSRLCVYHRQEKGISV